MHNIQKTLDGKKGGQIFGDLKCRIFLFEQKNRNFELLIIFFYESS
jgi:hypothetical protein